MERENTEAGKSFVHWDALIKDHNAKPVLIRWAFIYTQNLSSNCVFFLHKFQKGIAAAGKLVPSE